MLVLLLYHPEPQVLAAHYSYLYMDLVIMNNNSCRSRGTLDADVVRLHITGLTMHTVG